MKLRTLVTATPALFACLLHAVVLAHHGTSGIYNEDEIVELTGTVKAWRFVNPHPNLLIEVTGADGQTEAWDVSYGSSAVTHLRGRGYSADTFKPGDVISVRGNPARISTANGLLIRGDPIKSDGSPVVSRGR